MEEDVQTEAHRFSFCIIDVLESKSFSWILLPDYSNPWRAALTCSIFFLLTILVPILSQFLLQCSGCDYNHLRPFDPIVQLSLSVFSTLSFVSLSRFSRKYGLRRFLFLDKLGGVSDKVRHRYSQELHRSTKLLCAFVVPCLLADSIYNIWWFSTVGNKIPYLYNIYLSHTATCILQMSSWLYRTSAFFLVCVLFKLTCSLQILRLEDFSQVFERQSDVGPILVEHLTIKRNLRVISHRFRVFLLSTLILVTASQFASLLVITKDGSIVNIFTSGELALCSVTLVTGLYMCQQSAAKITHKAQSLTSLASKWHACATIDSFDDMGAADSEAQTTNITIERAKIHLHVNLDSDNEAGDGEDELDNTNVVPIYKHTVSYQKRQALVTYLENNEAGITLYGFMLDRTSINTLFAIQLSLALWLLDKTIGFS